MNYGAGALTKAATWYVHNGAILNATGAASDDGAKMMIGYKTDGTTAEPGFLHIYQLSNIAASLSMDNNTSWTVSSQGTLTLDDGQTISRAQLTTYGKTYLMSDSFVLVLAGQSLNVPGGTLYAAYDGKATIGGSGDVLVSGSAQVQIGSDASPYNQFVVGDELKMQDTSVLYIGVNCSSRTQDGYVSCLKVNIGANVTLQVWEYNQTNPAGSPYDYVVVQANSQRTGNFASVAVVNGDSLGLTLNTDGNTILLNG
jgi:hypothetical protein